MIEIRRILCPTDFSDCSRRALQHAAAVAGWYESTITLLHVYAAVPAAAYATGSGMVSTELLTHVDREALLQTMKRFAEAEVGGRVPIQFEIDEGNVAGGILNRAEAMAADLLVLGTHGRSGFERFTLGSVAEKVLRKAACPVLSIPPHLADSGAMPAAAFPEILCAIDFSSCSMQALNYALSLAQEASARLTVLHVLDVGSVASGDLPGCGPVASASLRAYLATAEEEAQGLLSVAVPESVRAYCTVDTRLAAGTPHKEILRVAAERNSDLIVMGVRQRGAADRLLFGSTAQHVLRAAACPVLTLRAD